MTTTYTPASPMAGHTPTITDVTRGDLLPTKPCPPDLVHGSSLVCECGFKWFAVGTLAAGGQALADAAYTAHCNEVQDPPPQQTPPVRQLRVPSVARTPERLEPQDVGAEA